MEYVVLLLKSTNKNAITPSFIKTDEGMIHTFSDYSKANYIKQTLKDKYPLNWYAIGVYNLPEVPHE